MAIKRAAKFLSFAAVWPSEEFANPEGLYILYNTEFMHGEASATIVGTAVPQDFNTDGTISTANSVGDTIFLVVVTLTDTAEMTARIPGSDPVTINSTGIYNLGKITTAADDITIAGLSAGQGMTGYACFGTEQVL